MPASAMDRVKVSIIVPTYNVAPYIYACLESVANQTYQGPVECLIVDDCGLDDSIQIAEDFMASYQGETDFRIIHRAANGGLSAARNTGLEYATGDYVYFLDSDDQLTPSCISSLVQPLEEEPYDFVIGNFEMTGPLVRNVDLKLNGGTVLRDESILSHFVQSDWYEMAWNKLVRRDLLQENGLFFKDGIILEDALWSFRLALAAKSMRVVDSICYIYFKREGSITTSASLERKSASTKLIAIELMGLARETNTILDIDVYDYIQWLFINTLKWSNGVSVEYGRQMYRELREGFGITLSQYLRFCHLKPRPMIRDLHYVVPAFIGYPLVGMTNTAFSVYVRIQEFFKAHVRSVNSKS